MHLFTFSIFYKCKTQRQTKMGNSLEVQWLRPWASSAGGMGLIFLVGELGSYMTHGIAKEKREQGNTSKHIFIWRDSCWKLPADWQKTFHTSRTVRNIHTECGMMRRETWCQNLCPWEGLRNRRVTPVEILPGEWSVWNIRWALQP